MYCNCVILSLFRLIIRRLYTLTQNGFLIGFVPVPDLFTFSNETFYQYYISSICHCCYIGVDDFFVDSKINDRDTHLYLPCSTSCSCWCIIWFVRYSTAPVVRYDGDDLRRISYNITITFKELGNTQEGYRTDEWKIVSSVV